ncbi:MAG TPA: hypothetical protein VFE05_19430 [Longimicrobiaceae bacterium]|jgi:hypothetical protein|nr:hypothetical protein [Longimicrobiaceae bacterium]
MHHAPRSRWIAAAVPLLALAAAQPGRAQGNQVTVTAPQVVALDARLRTFAAALPAGERGAWNDLLRRAAAAAPDNPSSIAVRGNMYSPHIIVQGGLPAGRAVRAGAAGGLRPDDPAALGPKQDDPHAIPAAGGGVMLGPKQDDPRSMPRASDGLMIGPKQDDPRASQALMGRLRALSPSLSPTDRATMDWLLQRAASAPVSPGGLPRGTPSLAQALGVAAVSDDPATPPPGPPPAGQWTLRF